MPVIYLRHAVHGTKVAISHDEMAADVENGWEEFDPTARKLISEPVESKRRGRRKSSDVPNFLAPVDDEGD
jgi:hypothetical protein